MRNVTAINSGVAIISRFCLLMLITNFGPSVAVWGQNISHICGTHIQAEDVAELDAHPAPTIDATMRAQLDPIEVPIRIHIVQCTANGQSGVSDANVNAGLTILNNYYSNVPMVFVECGSRNYIDNCEWFTFEDTEEEALAGSHDALKVINIYFVDQLIINLGTELGFAGGYTYFPTSGERRDRMFIDNEFVADGWALAHEMAHYFSVYHTNGPLAPGTTTELVSDFVGTGPLLTGDRLRDTPADPAKYNYMTTSATDCIYPFETVISPFTCPDFCDATGALYQPLGNNIMFPAYCPLGSFDQFTQGQYDRIFNGYNTHRTYLNGIDLVIQDASDDLGHEPNFNSSDIWYSPDLWNCTDNADCDMLAHANPEFETVPGNYNYMRARVTNKGCKSSPANEARMYMHWTLGRTGETWMQDWFQFPDNVIDGQIAGGEVIAIPLNSSLIPALAPGQSVIKTFKWNPPNPNLFTSLPAISDGNLDSWPMLCLLAYVRDMAADPLINNDNPTAVANRVRDNNNCATRNAYLTDLVVGNVISSNPIGTIYMQHIGTTIGILDLHVEDISQGQDYSFAEQGSLDLILDEELWQLWRNANFAGSGVHIVEDYVVGVTDLRHAVLAGLEFKPGEYHKIGLRFRLNENAKPEKKPYRFNVRHSVEGESELYEHGGGVFEVNVRPKAAKQEIDNNIYYELYIAPNPAQQNVTIYFTLPQKSIINLSIINLQGQIVKQILLDSPIQAGAQQITTDIAHLEAGMYICQLRTDKQVLSEKIITIH